MYTKKLNITESESRQIRKLYQIDKSDYVFDFVLTENQKYLIIMDQLFVQGGDGNSVGSIWENTHIFNEIIKESFSKLGLITENMDNKIIDNFVWKKELVRSIINSKDEINENLWNDIKSISGKAWETLSTTTVEWASFIFKKGVIPALQLIRNGLYTGVGIVIDVVVSILAAKTNAVVWFLVVLLDIYEIITGKYENVDRQENPYISLLPDLIGCVWTGAVAFPMKKMLSTAWKGTKNVFSKNGLKYLSQLVTKIPSLKTMLKNVGNLFVSKTGTESKGIISLILSGLDKILDGLRSFIQKLLSKEGLKATGMGMAVYGANKGVEYGINKYVDYKNNNSIEKLLTYDPNGGYTDEDFALN